MTGYWQWISPTLSNLSSDPLYDLLKHFYLSVTAQTHERLTLISSNWCPIFSVFFSIKTFLLFLWTTMLLDIPAEIEIVVVITVLQPWSFWCATWIILCTSYEFNAGRNCMILMICGRGGKNYSWMYVKSTHRWRPNGHEILNHHG